MERTYRTGFMMFNREVHRDLITKNMTFSEASKIIHERWQALGPDVQATYKLKGSPWNAYLMSPGGIVFFREHVAELVTPTTTFPAVSLKLSRMWDALSDDARAGYAARDHEDHDLAHILDDVEKRFELLQSLASLDEPTAHH